MVLPTVLPDRFVCIDTETTGVDPRYGAEMISAAAEFDNGTNLFWRDGNWEQLKSICEDPNIDKVFQNAIFDWRMLEASGIQVNGMIWDTMIFGHLLDGRDARKKLNLESLASKYLPSDFRKVVQPIRDWFEKAGFKPDTHDFSKLPAELLEARNRSDVKITIALFKRLYKTVVVTFPYLLDIEHRLLRVLKWMKDRGVLVDPQEAYLQYDQLGEVIDYVREWAEGVLGWTYPDFNINSTSHQLSLLMHGGLGPSLHRDVTIESMVEEDPYNMLAPVLWKRNPVSPIMREKGITEGSISLSGDILQAIPHPVPQMLQLGKKAASMRSKFIGPIMKFVNEDNLIFPTNKQCGTVGGRFSCVDPPMQTIPSENDNHMTEAESSFMLEMTGYNLAPHIKRLFPCRPGFAHVHSDKIQAEMVALAHYTDDKQMQDVFASGKSIHEEMCKLLWGELTKGLKTRTKSLVFGFMYGAGDPKLAGMLGTTITEARKFKQRMARIMPSLPIWKRQLETILTDKGYVESIHGRRHYLHDSESYMVINRICQTTVGDEVKNRMVALYDLVQSEGWDGDVCILLNIHDDIASEVREELIPEAVPKIIQCMNETDMPYNLPQRADLSITYKRWSDLKAVSNWRDPKTYTREAIHGVAS